MFTKEKNHQRKGFTMVELVFVIVILGILAGVALPKLMATRDDAIVTKGRSDVATIRSAIVSRRSQDILSGNGAAYPTTLDTAGAGNAIFGEVLPNPIYKKANTSGRWNGTSPNYTYRVGSTDVAFTYYPTAVAGHNAGTFDCDHTKAECKELTE